MNSAFRVKEKCKWNIKHAKENKIFYKGDSGAHQAVRNKENI
jgi:hypothetical protein